METDLHLRVVGKHLSVKICTNVQLDTQLKEKIEDIYMFHLLPLLELGESLW